MDYATLTDNTGRRADFRNIVIIMTSNAGARDLEKSLLGFTERDTGTATVSKAVDRIFSPNSGTGSTESSSSTTSAGRWLSA